MAIKFQQTCSCLTTVFTPDRVAALRKEGFEQEILQLIDQRKQLVSSRFSDWHRSSVREGSQTLKDTKRWTAGKITGAVYHGGQESGTWMYLVIEYVHRSLKIR